MTQTAGSAVTGVKIEWCKLLDWATGELWRGTVFRCSKAAWPYEEVVDFMLVAHPDSPSGFSMLVATGYKAGVQFLCLPAEAKAEARDVQAISAAWLVKNWETWIYRECPVEDVHVIRHYPAQVSVEGAPPERSRDLKV